MLQNTFPDASPSLTPPMTQSFHFTARFQKPFEATSLSNPPVDASFEAADSTV